MTDAKVKPVDELPEPQFGPDLYSEYSVQLGFSFNRRLGRNLELLRNAVLNQDFDCCIIVDGKEGAGKSVFGMQIAYFLDVERKLDLYTQVCFLPEQFKHAVKTLKKGKAIVWDEARRGLNRRRFGSDINLEITDMMAECRQNNLFLIIIMPTFYDMDLNVAVHRSRALIHVWYHFDPENRDKPLKRGFFRFYNEEGKKRLYVDKYLRQGYRYPHIQNMSFDSHFTKHYVIDEKEYRRLKSESANENTYNIDYSTLAFCKKHDLLIKKYTSAVAKYVRLRPATVRDKVNKIISEIEGDVDPKD